MKITTTYKSFYPLKLTSVKMQELFQILERHYTNLRIYVYTKKEDEIKFTNTDELLSYSNGRNRKIDRITVFGELGYDSTALTLRFKKGISFAFTYGNTMEVDFCLESEQDVLVFKAELDEWTKSIHQPKTYILSSKFGVKTLILLVALILGVVMFYAVAIQGDIMLQAPSASEIIFYLLFGAFITYLNGIIDNLWLKLFPPLVFLWGEELERENERKTIRTNLFWCVIVAAIVGVLVSIFTSNIL